MSDAIHMRPADPADGPCETCAWPDDGMPRRLVDAMRERHGKGGITVCRDCISRARRIALANALAALAAIGGGTL